MSNRLRLACQENENALFLNISASSSLSSSQFNYTNEVISFFEESASITWNYFPAFDFIAFYRPLRKAIARCVFGNSLSAIYSVGFEFYPNIFADNGGRISYCINPYFFDGTDILFNNLPAWHHSGYYKQNIATVFEKEKFLQI